MSNIDNDKLSRKSNDPIERDILKELSSKDVGDEMQRRIRYQHTVTAYYSLLMYLGKISYQEILCEHHEDIIGKLNDKEFHGIQVKTKDPSLGLLKINDEAIESSIIRFVELNLQFPNCFKRFIIVSNSNYLKDDTGNSIRILEEQLAVSNSPAYKLKPSTLEKNIKKIEEKARCSRKEVLSVLKKTAFQTMPGFDEIESKIIAEVMPHIDICASFTVERLRGILDNLIYSIYSRSSKKIPSSIKDYISLLQGKPIEHLIQTEVNNKRVTKDIIKSILSSANTQTYFLSSANEELSLNSNRQKIMIGKMNCGMIDPDAIAVMDQLRDSSEQYFLTAFHKNMERIDSKLRFTHIRSIVKNQAIEAKVKVKKSDGPYGEEMLKEIEARLANIAEKRVEDIDHCPYEILKGLVGSLTGECAVQFSQTPKGGWNFEK